MSENVVRIIDYEKRSKQADAAAPRDPTEADVIVLPVIRRFNAPAPLPLDVSPRMKPVCPPRLL